MQKNCPLTKCESVIKESPSTLRNVDIIRNLYSLVGKRLRDDRTSAFYLQCLT